MCTCTVRYRRRGGVMADEANSLNAIQRRCLAVLRRGRASDELREAASNMLRTGHASKRARIAGGVLRAEKVATTTTTLEDLGAVAVADDGWTCDACTLLNQGAANVCGACQAPRAPPNDDAGWACAACSLHNAARSRRCSACGQPRGRRSTKPGARPRPDIPSDDEDAQAFACAPAGRSKRGAAGSGAPGAAAADGAA